MNVICGGDRCPSGRLRRRDGWEVGGGVGSLEASVGEGLTLRYQPRRQFEPGRLDMVLFTEDMEVVKNDDGGTLRRVGVGLRYELQEVAIG
jgi:hypothetical protein